MLKKFTVHIDSNPDSGGVSVFATHFLKYLDYFDLNYEQRNVSRPVWQGVNIYTVLYVNLRFNVQGAGGLVKDQNFWVSVKFPS